jgi:hypothetical protein
VCDKDLETIDDLSKWNRLVSFPLLVFFDIVHEDDKVLCLAREVDFGLGCVSAGHDCWRFVVMFVCRVWVQEFDLSGIVQIQLAL